MVAPSAAQVPLHPDGEIGMHRGATAAANTPTILSHVSSLPVDKVAGAATGSLWAQFYPQQDRTVGRKILDEAQAAGCTAIVVTVDQQASYYERSEHNRNLGGSARRPSARGAAAALGVGRAGSIPRVHHPALVHVELPRRDSQGRQGAAAREGDSHTPRMRGSASNMGWTASSCPITAAGRWTMVRRLWKCCRKSSPQ